MARPESLPQLLNSIGLGALNQAFEDQRIDSIETCRALTDEELKSLGLQTIGDRVVFRRALDEAQQRPIEQSEHTTRGRVSQLFRPSRSGSRSHPRNRSAHVRTWTGNFFCLSDVNAKKSPSSSEKIALQASGLGLKKIQFKINDAEEVVYNTLVGEKGFDQLKDSGGFELLHCQSNCRELQILTCKWDVECLRQIIGSQAKIYIRPIQRNLKIQTSTDKVTTSLRSECSKCHMEYHLNDLREHILHCGSDENDATEDVEFPRIRRLPQHQQDVNNLENSTPEPINNISESVPLPQHQQAVNNLENSTPEPLNNLSESVILETHEIPFWKYTLLCSLGDVPR